MRARRLTLIVSAALLLGVPVIGAQDRAPAVVPQDLKPLLAKRTRMPPSRPTLQARASRLRARRSRDPDPDVLPRATAAGN